MVGPFDGGVGLFMEGIAALLHEWDYELIIVD